jgi:hypothetical protein
MPNFDDDIWSEALKEAWNSTPGDVRVLETLEFIFTRAGVLTAERFVRDRQALTATLEATAPVDPSTAVLFNPAGFEVTLPEASDTGPAPRLQIAVPNIGRVLNEHLMAAAYSPTPVQVIFRFYLSTDLSAPHTYPGPLIMDIDSITAEAQGVVATASFDDLSGRRFPRTEYLARLYPGLATR